MSTQDGSHSLLDCDEVLARLSDYRDGELDPGSRLAVERHIAECVRCARFGAEFMQTLEDLRRHLLTRPEGTGPRDEPGLRDAINRVLAAVAREAKR